MYKETFFELLRARDSSSWKTLLWRENMATFLDMGKDQYMNDPLLKDFLRFYLDEIKHIRIARKQLLDGELGDDETSVKVRIRIERIFHNHGRVLLKSNPT